MSLGLQCCVRCSALERGHTGSGDRYICGTCHRAGWYVDAGGNLRQVTNTTIQPPRMESA